MDALPNSDHKVAGRKEIVISAMGRVPCATY
jgi:hypothetical protein